MSGAGRLRAHKFQAPVRNGRNSTKERAESRYHAAARAHVLCVYTAVRLQRLRRCWNRFAYRPFKHKSWVMMAPRYTRTLPAHTCAATRAHGARHAARPGRCAAPLTRAPRLARRQELTARLKLAFACSRARCVVRAIRLGGRHETKHVLSHWARGTV